MKVEVEGEGEVDLPEDSRVSTLVKELDYHLDSVIVLLDDEPLSLEHELEDGMEVDIVSVVSGG
ncbi:MAG: MoaD/ThiS family protein [Candidatus Thermoplasmatota archaeon]